MIGIVCLQKHFNRYMELLHYVCYSSAMEASPEADELQPLSISKDGEEALLLKDLDRDRYCLEEKLRILEASCQKEASRLDKLRKQEALRLEALRQEDCLLYTSPSPRD